MFGEKMVPSLLIVCFLFAGLDIGRAEIGKDSKDLAGNYLACKCHGLKLNKTLDYKTARNIFETLLSSYKLNTDIQHQPNLRHIKLCEKCALSVSVCNHREDPNRRLCLRRKASFVMKTWRRKFNGKDETKKFISRLHLENSNNLIDMHEARSHNRHGRSLKRTDVCLIPSSLQTASLSCVAGTGLVKCVQRCAFGFTLDDGIRRKLICMNNEDKWTPTGFEECAQFVDCRIMLVKGGYANCSSMEEVQGPECIISCLPFEDKEETSEQSYRCQIDGTWNPPLPFCAEPQKGMMLVKAPAIKLHSELEQTYL